MVSYASVFLRLLHYRFDFLYSAVTAGKIDEKRSVFSSNNPGSRFVFPTRRALKYHGSNLVLFLFDKVTQCYLLLSGVLPHKAVRVSGRILPTEGHVVSRLSKSELIHHENLTGF